MGSHLGHLGDLNLSPEEDRILNAAVAEFVEEGEREIAGTAGPYWELEDVDEERPDLTPEQLAQWLEIANAEHRRLRMMRKHGSFAEREAIAAADRAFPRPPETDG